LALKVWYSPSTIPSCASSGCPSCRGEQRSQCGPRSLDDVPAGAAEDAFEFLDDLAVAAHRAVEALQVAVDDEDQVVELLAPAMPMAPSDSTSSVSPSPRKAQTLRSLVLDEPRLPGTS
jgi:hypothetical protein